MAHLLKDSLLIVVGGVALGLAANAVSPRGLSLTRDYFPRATVGPVAPTPAPAAGSAAAEPSPASAAGPTTTKRGLPLASHDEVIAWYHDPKYAEQRIVFIDARDDEHFAAGHIPGAIPFDHYHPERHLAAVLGASALAERMVVYCNGGDCEDSELATLDLLALGIPPAKLVIYGGGMTEWTRRKLPVQGGGVP